MTENSEQRSNWQAHLTGILAWLILVGGILYGVIEMIFVGFWSGFLLAAGVSTVCVLFAVGLLTLSHVLFRIGAVEDELNKLQKKE